MLWNRPSIMDHGFGWVDFRRLAWIYRLFYVGIMTATLEIIVYARLLLSYFLFFTSVLLVCTTVWIIWHHDSAVFDLTNNILPLLFFLTAIDRGSMLSEAQRNLMDNSALLLILKFGR